MSKPSPDQPITSEQRAKHMAWALALCADAEQRCVDRGCEDEDAQNAGESCSRYYRGEPASNYCDPCLMSALLGHAKEMEADRDALASSAPAPVTVPADLPPLLDRVEAELQKPGYGVIRGWLAIHGGASARIVLEELTQLVRALASPLQPVIGGDGPPVASCLLCGMRGPLATWYGGTRYGVCEGCRRRAASSGAEPPQPSTTTREFAERCAHDAAWRLCNDINTGFLESWKAVIVDAILRFQRFQHEAGAAPPTPITVQTKAETVCARCGHYEVTHGSLGDCVGWMPAGTGHTHTKCSCTGFVSRQRFDCSSDASTDKLGR